MDKCNGTNRSVTNGKYCDSVWDKIICWPTSRANTTVTIPCPAIRGSDTSRIMQRYCNENGKWEPLSTLDVRVNTTTVFSNSNECFQSQVVTFVRQAYGISPKAYQIKLSIARIMRILELFGLSASIITLLLCFVIYFYFRSLRNPRTRIHTHLMVAIFCTSLTKLIIFVDQMIFGYGKMTIERLGVNDTPLVCESMYTILEYSKTATSMWMFVEAIHLYHSVAVTSETTMSFKKIYLIIGWLFPLPIIIVWLVSMLMKFHVHCWFGYDRHPLFWILEMPRIITLVANTFYLALVVRVLFVHLKRERCNEIEKLRKLAKAMVSLLPLFGITNYLWYAEPNVNGSIWYFCFYVFVCYFLSSFQGTFISLFYCILNNEVKNTVSSRVSSLPVYVYYYNNGIVSQRSSENNHVSPSDVS